MLLLQQSHGWAPHTLHSRCSVKACSWHYTGSGPCPSSAWGHLPPFPRRRAFSGHNPMTVAGKLWSQNWPSCLHWENISVSESRVKLHRRRITSDTKVFSAQEWRSGVHEGHSSLSLFTGGSHWCFQLCGNRLQQYTKKFQPTSALMGKEGRKIILASSKAPIKIRF